MIRALSCLILLNATALAAQAPSFAGSWQVSYPAGVRNENGNITVLHGTGVLTIVAQGDSLIGSLAADPEPRVHAAPRLAAGREGGGRGGHLRLAFRGHAQHERGGAHGDGREHLEVQDPGDSLLGTVERKLEGYDIEGGSQPPQPVTGVRRKG